VDLRENVATAVLAEKRKTDLVLEVIRLGSRNCSSTLPFTLFTFSFKVDYVQRWGRLSAAAQCAIPT